VYKLRRINLHFFPPGLGKANTNTVVAMDALNIETAILSLPANSSGIISFETRSAAASLLRRYAESILIGFFFAGLPFLDDVTAKYLVATFSELGVLKEIPYALDELIANGVANQIIISNMGRASMPVRMISDVATHVIFSEYIEDDRYDQVWEELNRRQSVVFLHGAQTASLTPYSHPFLGYHRGMFEWRVLMRNMSFRL